MIGMVPFLGAVVIALLITGYQLCKSRGELDEDGRENKLEVGSLVAIFAIVFFVAFFILKMVADSSDNTQMFNNIKVGEPPF